MSSNAKDKIVANIGGHNAYMDNFMNIMEPGRMPRIMKAYNAMVAYRQTVELTPEQLKETVLNSSRIDNIVQQVLDSVKRVKSVVNKTRQQIAKHDKKKTVETMLQVKEMLDEIGLAKSLPVIRMLGMCITKILSKICTGVYVNETNLNKVKKTLGNSPVLYLPSHRSYADFVLMSYICFHYDIVIPGIAAGMDFHGMLGMGNLLRKTGAFFMRRTFSTDKTYWYVFKEYMHSLMTIYHTGVEFFIEGTRSRSNKALPPKIGLLSMALEPLFMGELTDVTVVPVSVSYEKPLEEQLFVYELLGVPKPKESTAGLLKSLMVLEQNYGSIYFDFGEPISAKDFFGDRLDRFSHALEPASVQTLSKYDLSLISELSHEVLYQQQHRIVLSTFSLICIHFNARRFQNRTITFDDLCRGVEALAELFVQLGAKVAVRQGNVEPKIRETMAVHQNILQFDSTTGFLETVQPLIDLSRLDNTKLKGHNLSQHTMKLSVPVFSLQLYNNPCVFWFGQPAILILAALDLSDSGKYEFTLELLRGKVQQLRHLFKLEFVFYQGREEREFLDTVAFLEYNRIFEVAHHSCRLNTTHALTLTVLSTIAPFLCCYYQACRVLFATGDTTLSEKALLVKVQEAVETEILGQRRHVHPYCLSLDSIGLVIQTLTALQCLTKSKTNETSVYTVTANGKLPELLATLEHYCQLLPFNYKDFIDASVSSKL